ncbi:MAG: NTP transferase domain-containing protein [Actinomycetota bacterium]
MSDSPPPNQTDTTDQKPLLVIMAAGLGSRFGGVKQLARVGPNDEAFLDLSIKDGVAAGFGDVVLIVRSDIEADVREQIVAQHGDLPVHYVRQDDLGPPRDKPWGTLHAVLSAVDVIDRPYAVINADDYYGPKSFELGAACMARLTPGRAANVAFEMGHTVPPSGSVTRAVTAVEDGYLTAIVETDECQRLADGTFSANGETVPGTTPVSMNFWCFHNATNQDFQERWETFLAANRNEAKAEAQLPTIVGELMADGRLVVEVVSSPEQWIGITNPEDFELAKAALADRG